MAIKNTKWKRRPRSPLRGASESRGFTLIEILAALAILSLVIVSLLVERNRALRQGIATRNHRLALRLAKTKLAEIRAGIETNREGTFEDRENFSWKLTEEPFHLETEEGELELYKWILVVTFPGNRGEATIEVYVLSETSLQG